MSPGDRAPVTGLVPTGVRADLPRTALAVRPSSLSGATLGVLANEPGETQVLLEAIAAELAESFGIDRSFVLVKPGIAVPPTEAQWQVLCRDATVVLTGFGGCGSCSSRSVRDAVELEHAGVPTVALVHAHLDDAARAMAKLCGAPAFRYAVLEATYGRAGWSADDIRAIARAYAPQVADLLTSAQTTPHDATPLPLTV